MAKKISSDWLIVAAMDFGTTYSGYAFSFRDSPISFQHPQTWCAGSTTLASLKTPTCLLLNADKSLSCFGYEAQDTYVNLVLEENHRDYFYFEHFKMTLHHNQHLSRKTTIDDILGRKIPALDVFSNSIKFLKNHFLKTLEDRLPDASIEDVMFVLTVPAIWRDSAKEFMREAAINAGIPPERITLALEPEAASIMCQNIPIEKLPSGEGFTISRTGTRYLIADIGGGTGDFTIHEKQENGTLKEISKASGGAYGGINVDRKFVEFLQRVMSKDAVQKLKEEEIGDYLDLVRDFEIKKRTATSVEEKSYVVRLSASFNKFAKENNPNFQNQIKDLRLGGNAIFLRDKLRFDGAIMKGFFHDTIKDILDHINTLLAKHSNVSHILLVGGYGECILLQEAIRREFPNQTLIVPQDCGLAVVKGAVLFGYNPETISARVLRYSYFTNSRRNFDPCIHDMKRREVSDFGDVTCKGTVTKIIAAGTTIVSKGLCIEEKSRTLSKDSKHITCTIYYSEEDDILYKDSEDCKTLGTIKIPVTGDEKKKKRCKAVFTFGLTYIQVKLTNSAGEEVEGTFDLLE